MDVRACGSRWLFTALPLALSGSTPYSVPAGGNPIHRRYEVHDLVVRDIMPQLVALSESYMQVFELHAPVKGESGPQAGPATGPAADVEMTET